MQSTPSRGFFFAHATASSKPGSFTSGWRWSESFAVRADDRFVDAGRAAEVIRIDDERREGAGGAFGWLSSSYS